MQEVDNISQTIMEKISKIDEKLNSVGNQVLELERRISALEIVGRNNQRNENFQQQRVIS